MSEAPKKRGNSFGKNHMSDERQQALVLRKAFQDAQPCTEELNREIRSWGTTYGCWEDTEFVRAYFFNQGGPNRISSLLIS